MAHYIYRDYRPGHRGQFASRETFNRSVAQDVECHVHRELIPDAGEAEEPVVIDSIDRLFDYEDYEGDIETYEIHGTGDTGRGRKR